MPSTCFFEFDRPEPIYYSGETINGRLIFNTNKGKEFKEMFIAFVGEAKVRWIDYHSRRHKRNVSTFSKTYTGHEIFVSTHTTLLPEGKLLPGSYEYTFSVALPPQTPSSCIESWGHISYEISLVIDRITRFSNHFRQPLTVLRPFNLNRNPELLLKIHEEDVAHFCCWPCKSGPVLSSLIIPFSGYAPGQSIKYSLAIDNRSKRFDLKGFKLRLVQHYVFTSQAPKIKQRTLVRYLSETGRNEIVPRDTKKVFNDNLLIPPVPPTSQDECLIVVKYYIEVKIKLGDCHSSSKILVPIIIGTIPLQKSLSNPDNAGDSSEFEIKPHSYESSAKLEEHFIDTDIDEHSRVEGFIPKYPMYKDISLM